MIEYDYNNDSKFTLEDCRSMIGRSAQINLTGQIVDAGESPSGPYVTVLLDGRWGFGEFRFSLDLDALEGFH